jgi:transposase
LLRLHPRQIDGLNEVVAKIDQQVRDNLAPFCTAVRQLYSIPGIKDLSGQNIISEIGIDMSGSAAGGNLVSWTGLCQRKDESAGKRRCTRLRKGGEEKTVTYTPCSTRSGNAREPKRPSVPSPPRC